MSNELIKETITLNQCAGKETTQVLLEGDLIVPDVKPDVSAILRTDAEVFFDRTEVTADRISFSGKLNLYALYLAKGSEKPVHSMNASAPVEDFLNMDGVNKDMWVEISAHIANIDYKLLNDRKISYRAVVDVTITAEAKSSYEIVSNIKDLPETQIKRRPLAVNRTVENKEDRFTVKEELSIPTGKPNIRDLLQTSVAIANKEVKVGNGRVTVSGELIISTLYRGDDDESVIEFVEHETPFNGMIDAPGARDGMFGDVTLRVRDHYAQAKPDADGEDRVIGVEVSIGATVAVSSQSEIMVLSDAYCINKNVNMVTEPVKYPRLVCRNKNQCPIKEDVGIDANCPDILQIFRVTGSADIDDIRILDDKLVVEGIINADVLYIAENDDAPLYNFKTTLPYKQVIEMKGAAPDMEADVECSIDHTGFNMLSGKEMELRFLLNFNAKVTDRVESSVITDVTFSDIDKTLLDRMPSMTIYVAQKGDSLWNIAKRFNTSIEELVDVNEIENPDKIYPGQKLLILKKIYA